MYITEQKEEMMLTLLEQTGATLRKLKAEIRQLCSMSEYAVLKGKNNSHKMC